MSVLHPTTAQQIVDMASVEEFPPPNDPAGMALGLAALAGSVADDVTYARRPVDMRASISRLALYALRQLDYLNRTAEPEQPPDPTQFYGSSTATGEKSVSESRGGQADRPAVTLRDRICDVLAEDSADGTQDGLAQTHVDLANDDAS